MDTPSFHEGSTAAASLAQRLERSEVIFFPKCPFPVPAGEDRAFILDQKLAGGSHKNISYDPKNDKLAGFHFQSREQAERLRELMASFSRNATAWLASALPRYARTWQVDRGSLRSEEEATRDRGARCVW